MSGPESPPGGRTVLVLGEPRGLGVALVRRLRQDGVPAEAGTSLGDSETSAVLREPRWGAVAVVTREDVLALRLTLLSAHLRPDFRCGDDVHPYRIAAATLAHDRGEVLSARASGSPGIGSSQ